MTVLDFGTSSRDRKGAVVPEPELKAEERETASLRARLDGFGLHYNSCPRIAHGHLDENDSFDPTDSFAAQMPPRRGFDPVS